MWCLWAVALLGLAVRVSSKETPPVSCNGSEMLVQPPLWVKMFKDEAHFVCSPGYKLRGQNILTCINTNWDHGVPTCEKLPTNMIKMKLPFNHSEWTLENLDMISRFLLVNEDSEIILSHDYIDDSPESQRLAAEMMARFDDPFFRFYGLLPTLDKGLPMQRLIRRFKESSQFIRLRKQMREEFFYSDFPDIDEDENVLIRYYGLHFVDVLQDVILPYRKLIAVRSDIETARDTKKWKTSTSESASVDSFSSTPSAEQVKEIRPPFDEGELSAESILSAETSSENGAENIVTGMSRKKKKEKRARGDIEKLIPLKEDGKDYFRRPVEQVLTGWKAEEQRRQHRESYVGYLKTIVEHIITYKVPREKWPEYLRQFDLNEISVILEIPNPVIPGTPECNPPSQLGFELVSNGTATLDGPHKVIIRCNPGYYLRGATELYCDRGRWVSRQAGMPICVSQQRGPQCDAAPPTLLNGRIIKADREFVFYECYPGYTNLGTDIVLCRNNKWVPNVGNTMPTCSPNLQPVRCGNPPVPANGAVTEPHYMQDGRRLVVRYFCDANYSMLGQDHSFCVNGQWAPYSFRCMPDSQDNVLDHPEMPQQLKTCPKLVVPNASVKYYEDGRSSVRVTCIAGYKMAGSSLVRCENGTYVDPIPKCVDRLTLEPCGPAISPQHGSAQYVTDSAVRFSCDPGYVLRGRDRVTCYRGQWSDPTPECMPRSGCDNNEQLLNKNLVGYKYSNGRWLECADRLEMIGEHHQYCRNGRWDPEPSCVTSGNNTSVLYSEFYDCPLPELPSANGITISSRGLTIYYRCEVQDAFLRGERINKCVDGRWIHPAPYCERRFGPYVPTLPAPPPPPPPPPVASLGRCSARPIRAGEAYVYSEGRAVVYQCKINYLIRGQTTLNCERSQWSAPLPQCYNPVSSLAQEDGEIYYDAISCPTPPYYPGTSSWISNRGLRLLLSCTDDEANSSWVECMNGRWVGRAPECSSRVPPGVCEPLEIPNGKFFMYSQNRGYIQCSGNHVIENTTDSRVKTMRCDSNTGQWDFFSTLPKCVPQPLEIQDDRPYDNDEDSKWDNRQLVDECGPPEVSTKFSYYIQGDGRSVALKCKRRAKRSVGLIKCTEGSWEFAADICDSDCALDDVKIDNGTKVVYDENEYVFQCLPNYELIGAAVAHCPEYTPNAFLSFTIYDTSLVQEYGPSFKAPECRWIEKDRRPISRGDVLDSDSFQSCRWLAEFGKFDLKPEDYYISNRGRFVTRRQGAKEVTAECQNGMWVSKAVQVRDKCSSLPTEPDHGTYYLYEDSNGITVYFQCIEGYRLVGSRVSVCGSYRVPVPDCVADSSAGRYMYPKSKNGNPTNNIRCPAPPEFVPNAEVTIHSFGGLYAINCNPGFLIETTGERSAPVHCTQRVWYPETLPRCVRDGERFPLPRFGGRRDLFGRQLPQELTGEKARLQDEQLREQFRSHAMQLVEFAKARNRELRQSGVPPDQIPVQGLPFVSTITDEEKDKLFRENEQIYREIEALLISIKDQRNRQRRQNLLEVGGQDSDGIRIPDELLQLESQIRKYNLTQQDIDIMKVLSPELRTKYLEDKKNQQEKSKSDPVRSQDFVRKFLPKKTKSKKKDSEEDNKVRSVELDNSIEQSASLSTTEPSSSESTSTEKSLSSTTESATRTPNKEVPPASTAVVQTEASTVTESSAVSTTNVPTSSSKGYDESCRHKKNKAPEIENGFILSYDVLDEPEGNVLQASYRCFEGYAFEFEHTAKVRCRNGDWVGELPTCIPEPEEDDEDEDAEGEGSDSQQNKLK